MIGLVSQMTNETKTFIDNISLAVWSTTWGSSRTSIIRIIQRFQNQILRESVNSWFIRNSGKYGNSARNHQENGAKP